MYKKGDRVITTVDIYCCSVHKYIREGSVCKIYEPHPYGKSMFGMNTVQIRTFDKMPNTYATFTVCKDDIRKI